MPDSPYASRPWSTSYAEGVPLEIDEPSQTLPEMLAASVARYGKKTALEFFGAPTTYQELGRQVARAAEGLRRLGVRAGDRVALVLPNSPQHVVAFYAALRLGAIVIEHNPLYTPRELRHQFEDHGARFAIVWDKLADTVAEFPSDLALEHIVSIDITEALPLGKRLALRLPVAKARQSRAQLTATPTSKRPIAWKQLLTHGSLSRKHAGPALDDIALLQYTSGTTGSPKGAVLTHANLRANAMQGRAWVPGLHDGEETFYGVLPLFHAYGLTLCLTFAMSIGAKLVLFPKYDLDLVVAASKKSPRPSSPPYRPSTISSLALRPVARSTSRACASPSRAR